MLSHGEECFPALRKSHPNVHKCKPSTGEMRDDCNGRQVSPSHVVEDCIHSWQHQ